MADAVLPSPAGQVALTYARHGWKVFPCRERESVVTVQTRDGPKEVKRQPKAPYASDWRKVATTDEQVILGWWRRHPQAMIGLPMGENGLFALDFDPRVDPETGEVFDLVRLKSETEAQIGCALPTTLASLTQSGGVHAIYRQPREGEPIRNRGNLPRHVDVRGMGGYIVAPGSVMAEQAGGGRYRWLHGRQDVAPVDAPDTLIEVLRARKRATNGAAGDQPASASSPPPAPRPAGKASTLPDEGDAVRKYALSALDAECRELEATPIGGGQWGGRNNGIYHAALKLGGLVAAGAIGEGMVRAALADVIHRMPHNDDPDGALKAIDNGLGAGMATPRDLSEILAGARQRASRRPSARRPRTPSGGQEGKASGSEGSGGGTDQDGGPGEDAAEIHRRCISKPHTDLGNAERFFERFGDAFRWSPALGWLGWDGRRWAMLDQDEKNTPPVVLDAVFRTVRAIQDEATLIEAAGGLRPAWLDAWGADGEEAKLSVLERAELALYRKADETALAEAERTLAARRDRSARPAGDDQVEDDQPILDHIVEVKKGRAITFSEVHRKYGRSSEAAGKLGCIARLAQPWLAVRTDAFDADPMTINVMNGTLRFRRRMVDGKWKAEWRLDPHRRADLITKLAPVVFDRDALCPIYDRTMAWAQKKPAMRRYLHQWGGLSCTGHMGEQKLHFWYGLGGNGKSTIMDAWCFTLGDYTTTVPIETFLDQGIKKRGDQATPDLARLGGVRLLRTSEPERGARIATALIKLVTGGEPMSVRYLNRGFFDLRPLFKMTIAGNFMPEISDTDEGIWRRLKLIPWPEDIGKEPANPDGTPAKDVDLPVKLQGEVSGIFNRLVDGLLDWLENGLIEAIDVTRATSAYRSESDPLGRFLKLCTEPAKDGRVQSSHLHALFVAWCQVAGEKPWTNKGFSKALIDKGYEKKTSDGVQWLGIVATREVSDFVDEQGHARPFNVEDAPAPGLAERPPPEVRPPPDPDDFDDWPP